MLDLINDETKYLINGDEKEMKKIIVSVFAVLITVFLFSATTFSQEECDPLGNCACDPPGGPAENCGNISDITGGCTICDTTKLQNCAANVPCGGQGTALTPFDFDGEPYNTGNIGVNIAPAGSDFFSGTFVSPSLTRVNAPVGLGQYGYCTDFNRNASPYVGGPAADAAAINRDCKFIFDACMCPDACELTPGTRIGIQMIIITPGVYFADAPMIPDLDAANPTGTPVNSNAGRPTVFFEIGNSTSVLCQKTAMGTAPVYLDRLGNPISSIDTTIAAPLNQRQEIRNFGPVTFHTAYVERQTSRGEFVSSGISPVVFDNTRNLTNQNAVFLESNLALDYLLTDTDAAGQCFLWIDTLPLRVTEQAKGQEIKVKVRLLFHKEKSICEDCSPPAACECMITIGKVCCDTTTAAAGNCMYFPYVLQNLSPWWSGVAISAREELPADAYCKLTVIDKRGNTATYTKTSVTDSLWSFIVDDIISNFGTSFAAGAVTLKVESNYSMHGYSFLTDGTFGAGTLATGCTPGSCAP